MARAAHAMVLINDLIRSRLGYLLAYIGTRFLTTSYVVHQDGLKSVRAAFTVSEAKQSGAVRGHGRCVILLALAVSFSSGVDAPCASESDMIMAIPATVSLAEANARFWDAIVVGAGPAGSLAAREMARHGLTVLLVDHARFPRPKVCGCCLNLRALATLAQARLGNLVQQCGAVPLQRLILATSGSQASVPFLGMALSRNAFDAALVEAAIEAGVCFLPETHAVLSPVADPMHRVTLLRIKDGNCLPKVVSFWAQGGLGSNLHGDQAQHSIVESASRLGAGVIVEQYPKFFGFDTVYMACANGGYVGLVRLEDGRLNIAAAFDVPFVKRGLAVWVKRPSRSFAKRTFLPSRIWKGLAGTERHNSRALLRDRRRIGSFFLAMPPVSWNRSPAKAWHGHLPPASR